MYELGNKVDPPQPNEIVLQNVLIDTLEILPQSANFIDISMSTLSFNTESPAHWDTASRVTFPRTFIIKIFLCNVFVLQLVSVVLAQISTLHT